MAPVTPVSRRVMNLGDLMTGTARRLPKHPALVWGERTWTWGELDARVDALARALAERGIAKGDRVLVQARNSNQMLESQWAAFKLGAIWVPVNFRLAPPEVAYIARTSGARALISDDIFAEHAAAARAAQPGLGAILVVGEAAAVEGGEDYEAAIAPHLADAPFTSAAVERDDPCWFFFTSGTTGHPKAAVLTHGQLAFVANNHLADLMPGATHRDGSLVVAPLSHGAGVHLLAQVARGSTSVLTVGSRLDPEEVFSLVARHRVANMFTVPTILARLTEDDTATRHDTSSLRHVIYAGSPMYRADQRRAIERLGKCIVQYFGLGEVTGNITVLPADEHDVDDAVQGRIGTCGYARTGMEVAIFDDAGRRLAAGETGEICVIGPAVFAGYWENEEANAKAFRDGWFRTGDLGHMDAAGYLYITGRASDIFISGGSNIYPREIEEVALQHPGVAEAAVVGVPDARWGEVGAMAVVRRAGASVSEAELRAFLEARLARYKLPKTIAFLSEMPRSAYGKVPKRMVREALVAAGAVPPAAER